MFEIGIWTRKLFSPYSTIKGQTKMIIESGQIWENKEVVNYKTVICPHNRVNIVTTTNSWKSSSTVSATCINCNEWLLYARGVFISKFNLITSAPAKETPLVCKCDMQILMARGCQCGNFKRKK